MKAFRASLRRTTMCTLEDYATALVGFVEGNELLFPPELRLSLFRAMAVRSVRSLLAEVQSQQVNGSVATSPSAALARIRETLQGRTLPRGCSEMEVRKTIEVHMEWLSSDGVKAAANTEELRIVASELSLGELCEAAVRNIYVNFHAISEVPPTGVVLVGFGDADVFPGVRELQCYGLVFDRLIPAGPGEFGVSNPPARPRTPAEKYDEMMRRRAYFRQRIAEYDASRVEPEAPSCAMW